VVNELVASDGQKYNVPVNVVDNREISAFIVPSIAKRGDLIISVSTCGKSPFLARKIREKLEAILDDGYGDLLQRLYEQRTKLKAESLSEGEKMAAYEKTIEKAGF